MVGPGPKYTRCVCVCVYIGIDAVVRAQLEHLRIAMPGTENQEWRRKPPADTKAIGAGCCARSPPCSPSHSRSAVRLIYGFSPRKKQLFCEPQTLTALSPEPYGTLSEPKSSETIGQLIEMGSSKWSLVDPSA